MARPKETLDAKYGQLTVIEELDNSRVLTQCSCGLEKIVGRSNLRAGRVRSCGAEACRERNGAARRGPKVTHPRWIEPGDLQRLWDDRQRGIEVATLAEELQVSTNTLYAFFRRLEAAGGVDNYLAKLDEPPVHVPREAPTPARVAFVIQRGVVPAPPPPMYVPKGNGSCS